MGDAPRNLEILAQNGSEEFDVTFLDRPGGVPIQPSRNGDPLDKFDPLIPAQDDPDDFIVVDFMIWNEAGQTIAAAPGAYNKPTLAATTYGGTTGKFTVDATGANTRLSSALIGERWVIVWDTQINGNAFRTYEFVTVLSDGDAAFGGTGNAYGDPDVVKERVGQTYAELGFATEADYDSFLASMNYRASTVIDTETHRDFILHSADVAKLDGNDLPTLMLPGYPVVTISSVTEDGVAIDGTTYRMKSPSSSILERKPPDLWHWDGAWERYVVNYTWGYTTPPYDVKQVAENLMLRAVQARQASLATQGSGPTSYAMDGFSVSYDQAVLRGSLTADDMAVLARYRRLLTV